MNLQKPTLKDPATRSIGVEVRKWLRITKLDPTSATAKVPLSGELLAMFINLIHRFRNTEIIVTSKGERTITEVGGSASRRMVFSCTTVREYDSRGRGLRTKKGEVKTW